MKNCREVCDCLAIQPVSGPLEGLDYNVPKMVDPMLYTGEGTCAAAPWILQMEQQ